MQKFKVGDWVRIRKDVTTEEYPELNAGDPDDLVQVLKEFPAASTTLLVVTDVAYDIIKEGSDIKAEGFFYHCTIHPMFPWHDAFAPIGEPGDAETPNSLTLYECELEAYDGSTPTSLA